MTISNSSLQSPESSLSPPSSSKSSDQNESDFNLETSNKLFNYIMKYRQKNDFEKLNDQNYSDFILEKFDDYHGLRGRPSRLDRIDGQEFYSNFLKWFQNLSPKLLSNLNKKVITSSSTIISPVIPSRKSSLSTLQPQQQHLVQLNEQVSILNESLKLQVNQLKADLNKKDDIIFDVENKLQIQRKELESVRYQLQISDKDRNESTELNDIKVKKLEEKLNRFHESDQIRRDNELQRQKDEAILRSNINTLKKELDKALKQNTINSENDQLRYATLQDELNGIKSKTDNTDKANLTELENANKKILEFEKRLFNGIKLKMIKLKL